MRDNQLFTHISILVEIVIWYCIFKWSDCLFLFIVFPRSMVDPPPPWVRCDAPLWRIDPFAKLKHLLLIAYKLLAKMQYI